LTAIPIINADVTKEEHEIGSEIFEIFLKHETDAGVAIVILRSVIAMIEKNMNREN
jgi:hypothetical protein